MSVVETTIRINADSRQAVNEIARLERASNVLGKRSMPLLGGAFGSLSSQALSMTTGISGAGRALSTLGQAALIASPMLGGLLLAATAVAAILLKQRDASEKLTSTFNQHFDALASVSTGTSQYADEARELLAVNNALVVQEQKRVEHEIVLAQAGMRQASMWERLAAAIVQSRTPQGIAISQIGVMNISADEQTRLLTELIAKWQALSKTIVDISEVGVKKQKDIDAMRDKAMKMMFAMIADQGEAEKKLADERNKHIEATLAASVTAAQLRLRAEQNSVLGIMAAFEEERRAVEFLYDFRLNTFATTAEEEIRINAERDNALMQLELTRRETTARIQADTTVDLSRQAGYREAIQARAARAVLLSEARIARGSQALFALTSRHFEEFAHGRISLAQAVAASMVTSATEAAAAELEALAQVWAAEAIAAAAIGNFGRAAGLLAAVAAAGAGAGIVRGLGASAAERIAGEDQAAAGFEDDLTAGGQSGRRGGSGRSVIAQGPVTLYYNASLTVNGHVFDKGDIFEQFDEWNEQQLKRAGFDLAQQAR